MPIPMDYLNLNCLVVDDEPSMRLTVKNMLTRMGFEKIILTENGKKALEFIETVKIDIVIADVNMPEMSGIELFKTVREDRRYDNIVFIFLTAETRRQAVARVAEEGGDGYVIKPFVMATLEDKLLKTLDKKFKPKPIDMHMKDFKAFLEAGDLKNAEDELKKAAELAPNSAAITYKFGRLALALGDKDKAIDCFKKTIDQNPLFVKAYNALGGIYEDTGDMESAIKYYELAHNISPENTERLIALSKLYHKTGETEKSKGLLDAALSDSIGDVSTTFLLLGEMSLSKNENEQAVKILVKANKKNPFDVSIMQSLAEAYRRVSQPKDAVKMYEDILRINPKNAYVYYNIGKTYLEMDVKNKAIDNIKKAWELNPFSVEITNDLKALAEKEKFDI